jgi:transposase InsO family protein
MSCIATPSPDENPIASVPNKSLAEITEPMAAIQRSTDSESTVKPDTSTDDAEPRAWEDLLAMPRGELPSPPARRAGKGRRLAKPQAARKPEFTGQQRLLLLDTWRRSGLPAGDFAPLVGISKHTLYAWKKRFEEQGPAGLMDQPRGSKQGSRLPELTKRTILMLKESHPEWGCQRISDMLARGPALPAGPSAVARVLHEAGYQRVDEPTQPHPQKARRFERAKPNQLWQTDLFTFMLKRQNRRVYLVAFLDDHSRFVVSYGLHASASTALVLEVLEAGIAAYGPPEETLTDNGPQYVTWRGKSRFTKHLEKRGIRQIVARPKRPQTLGKIERFWGTMWREFLETAVFADLEDARRRIGLFIDYYNFQRTHRGVGGLVPADRFFGAAPEVLKTLKQRVADNALQLSRHGVAKEPFYLTGQLDGQPFSVHREGDRVVLRRADQEREEIELLDGEPSPAAASPDLRPDTDCPPAALPAPLCPQGAPARPAEAGLDQKLPDETASAEPPLDQSTSVAGTPECRDETAEGGDRS